MNRDVSAGTGIPVEPRSLFPGVAAGGGTDLEPGVERFASTCGTTANAPVAAPTTGRNKVMNPDPSQGVRPA